MKLTQEQKDVIVGSLLGDGNLQTETQGRTWRYRALQHDKHLEYLEYKYNVLKDLCSTGIIHSKILDDRTGKVYKRNYFNTQVHECLRHYGNIFYTYDTNLNKFVKDVPKTIAQVLTPRALAIMYQDDGALKQRWKGRSNAMRICTESFTLDGLNRFKSTMKDLYGINITLTAKKKDSLIVGYRVSIPEASSAAFVSLIKPYLIDCMKYKVTDGNKGSLG
jgi:recombination protein RecA